LSISTPDFKPIEEINEAVGHLDLDDEILAAIIRSLDEDIRTGDVTTNSIIAAGVSAVARIVAKQGGIVSGLAIVQAVFLILDRDMHFRLHVSDGAEVKSEQLLIELKGSARAILTGERAALNFLGRMSGIATLAGKFVEAIAGTEAVVLDTRKTAPGLRAIDKLAVRHGGGRNHRFGLYDMVLVKDNHIDCAGSLSRAIRLVKAGSGDRSRGRRHPGVARGIGPWGQTHPARQHVARRSSSSGGDQRGSSKVGSVGECDAEQRARNCRDWR